MAKRPFFGEEDPEDESQVEEEEDEETEEQEETESDDDEEEQVAENGGKRIMIRVVSGERRGLQSHLVSCSSANYLCCQADECGRDLSDARRYHRRHKVCDRHAKAPVVLVKGIRQRFCQQCSRFHEISQFDDTKRSCRKRLAGHNERRRKTQSDLHSEDTQDTQKLPVSKMSSNMLKATRHPNHGEMALQGRPNTNHFRIR